jgi:signal transduction histidine kinase
MDDTTERTAGSFPQSTRDAHLVPSGRAEPAVSDVHNITARKETDDARRANEEALRWANERLIIAGVREQEEAERAEAMARSERAARLDSEQAQRRLSLLVESGRQLASSLDYEATLQQVARLAIPVAADWCVVDLLTDAGELKRGVAIAHVDPGKETLVRQLDQVISRDSQRLSLCHEFLRGGQSILRAEIGSDGLAQMAESQADLDLLQQLGPRSLVAVHLEARGVILGAMRFVTSESERRYGPQDVLFFEELARQAALAIDNASLYRALQDASAAKDRFLAVVSHELRNPLATITTAAAVLKSVGRDDERGRAAVGAVERAVKLQARMVEDLLDLSRMTRETLQLRCIPVRLDALVAATVQSVQSEVASAEIALSVDLEPGQWVEGDADRLHQVAANLIGNAVKFTPRGGDVRVICQAHNRQHVRLVVEDTGIGIDAALVPHVFEMFQQGSPSGKRRSGLGIGLALVKGLVEAQGGNVWAESDGPGKGSRFVVDLPRLPDAEVTVRSAQDNLET